MAIWRSIWADGTFRPHGNPVAYPSGDYTAARAPTGRHKPWGAHPRRRHGRRAPRDRCIAHEHRRVEAGIERLHLRGQRSYSIAVARARRNLRFLGQRPCLGAMIRRGRRGKWRFIRDACVGDPVDDHARDRDRTEAGGDPDEQGLVVGERGDAERAGDHADERAAEGELCAAAGLDRLRAGTGAEREGENSGARGGDSHGDEYRGVCGVRLRIRRKTALQKFAREVARGCSGATQL